MRHDSAKRHILGVAHAEGTMTPKFELSRDFCAMHLPPKFRHPMFTRSEVIVLTHKQTHRQTPPKVVVVVVVERTD